VQKSQSFEKHEPGVKKILFGHPFLHRLLKDMIKAEVAGNKAFGA